MVDENRVRKLRWLCRRGMKELDILLERFIEANAAQLSRGDWPGFEMLLRSEDDVLWDWVQNPDSVEDPACRDILAELRNGHA